MAKQGLRAAGMGGPDGPPFSSALIARFQLTDTWIEGAFALEQGFVFSAMVLAAATVEGIEQRFARAAAWCALGALLCTAGLMHSYAFTPGDTVVSLSPAWPWATGYLCMAACFLAARWLTEAAPEDAPSGH